MPYAWLLSALVIGLQTCGIRSEGAIHIDQLVVMGQATGGGPKHGTTILQEIVSRNSRGPRARRKLAPDPGCSFDSL